jgi:hypothetical protein
MKKLFRCLIGSVFLLVCLVSNAPAYVVFQEDFSSLADWNDESGRNKWSIENGVLVADWFKPTAVPSDPSEIIYFGGLDLPESFVLTVEARMVISGAALYGGSDYAGFLFNFHDRDNFFSTSWRQNEYNDFLISGIVSGVGLGHFGLIGANAYNFDETAWHTIKLVKDLMTASAFINDDLMYTETVPLLNGGTVGLTTSWGKFEFDNLLITSTEPVPEPATMLLVGSGLIGLAGFRRRLRK